MWFQATLLFLNVSVYKSQKLVGHSVSSSGEVRGLQCAPFEESRKCAVYSGSSIKNKKPVKRRGKIQPSELLINFAFCEHTLSLDDAK